ncbi:PEP-CTERM sorting domain-containing protein [Nitrosospira lacus]|uniref:Ice-binding protein C-terminal domain-containing protein n=2 Tax=Nitrosospira lacus TaxID=1288494 RepID=A0A1W6SMG3_9PROT|nr:PEP-CTERM sorting domain-containing protein [Nitrosospira lacus]
MKMEIQMTKKVCALAIAGIFGGMMATAQAAPYVGTLDTRAAANVNNAVGEGAGTEPAAPSATGGDGLLQTFTGFDWHSNGAGFVQGYGFSGGGHAVGDTDSFTITTQFFAGSIGSSTTTPDLRVATPGPSVGTYEYTAIGQLLETATVTSVDGGGNVTGISIVTNAGGFFNIYFDISPDANPVAGTGFFDGTPIISGVFSGGLSSFSASGSIPTPGVIGVGGGTVFGVVTSVNNTYVNPTMVGTEVGTTLNFPGTTGAFTRPAFINGIATGVNTGSDFVLQTDAFQTFSIPEPGSIALIGLGLVGFGFMSRRNRKQG